MPSYNTHYLLSKEITNELNINSVYGTKIMLSSQVVGLFSQGQDLTYANQQLFRMTHQENYLEFFSNLLSYIKDNKLYDEVTSISFLYGHIMHYALDSILHPFVYDLENKYSPFKYNHQIIEWQIDELIIKRYHTNLHSIDNRYLLDFTIYKETIIELINKIYEETYNVNNVVSVYQKSQYLIYLLTKLVNLLYAKDGTYHQIVANSLHNPLTDMQTIIGDNSDLYHLINKAFDSCYELIVIANKYLYGYNNDVRTFTKCCSINYIGERRK